MNAAKYGYIAEFQTGYLQREVRYEAIVTGGTDGGLRTKSTTAGITQGFAPGRLVKATKITSGANKGRLHLVAAGSVTATSIGDATHIIAQSDATIRDIPSDYNYQEQYSSLPDLICKNTGTMADTTYVDGTGSKTVALYKIVNVDDIKIIDLGTDPNNE